MTNAPIFAMPIIRKPGMSYQWFPTERDRARALKNHGQTLERLRERGGVNWGELACILEDRHWDAMSPSEDENHARVSAEISRRYTEGDGSTKERAE